MTATRFAPGPWSIHPADEMDFCDYRIVAADGGTVVSRGYEGLDGGVYDRDDALLIAAAPDLYAALREVTAVAKWLMNGPIGAPAPQTTDGWLTRATTALARATGEAIPVASSTSSRSDANPE